MDRLRCVSNVQFQEPIGVSEQLAKVQTFRKELGLTSLYGTFVAAEDLGRLLRIHLTRHLFRYGNPHSGSEAPFGLGDQVELVPAGDQGGPTCPTHRGGRPTDDEGLLDLVERTSEAFAGVRGPHVTRSHFLPKVFERHRLESRRPRPKADKLITVRPKEWSTNLADKVDSIAARFEVDVQSSARNWLRQWTHIKGTEVSAEFGVEGIEAVRGSRSSVASLATQSESALEVVDGLRTSDELPRVTTQFNRARKRLSAILGAVHREFSSANTLVREAIAVVDQTLKRFDPNGEGGS